MAPRRHKPVNDSITVLETGVQSENLEKGYWRSFRFIGSCTAIVLLANNLFAGYVMPVNVLGVINADIGPSPNIWLVTLLNTLIKGILLLLVGSVSDAVGRRYFMIAGQSIGVIGAIICALAKSINVLIAGNVLMGMAASGQLLFPLLIHEIVPNKYRGFGQAGIMLSAIPTLGLGPALSRAFVNRPDLGWRWIYWLNVIISGVSLILFTLCYFPPTQKQLSRGVSGMQQLRQIDYGGFLLYGGGLVSILLGLTWSTGQYSWRSAMVIGTFVGGLVLFFLFSLYEIYVPLEAPLLPMKLFKIRNFVVAVIVGSVAQMSYYSLNVLWPTQITSLYTRDNGIVGWMSCTTGAALILGEVVAGPFFKRLGHMKMQNVLGMIGLNIFCGIMALGNEHRQGLAIAMTFLVGIFVGWVELIAIVAVGLVIPPENMGSGQAFFASTRAVSGSIATSIYLSIFSDRLTVFLPERITPAVVQAGLPESSLPILFKTISSQNRTAIASVPGMNATIQGVLEVATKTAYSSALKIVYLSSLSFGGAALIVSFFASDVDKYMTSYVNKRVVPQQAEEGAILSEARIGEKAGEV